MRLSSTFQIVLPAVAGLACASTPAPVPVVARDGDLSVLAGEWRGEYQAPAVDRHGSITFTLKAGTDTAQGDVIMIPRGWDRPLSPAERPAAAAAEAPRPEVLTIRFVWVEGGAVSGELEPYRDPDCGCPIYTTFTGRVVGDVIEGSFLARYMGGDSFTGTWRAVRKRA